MRFEPKILFKKISFKVLTIMWIILLKCYNCEVVFGSILLIWHQILCMWIYSYCINSIYCLVVIRMLTCELLLKLFFWAIIKSIKNWIILHWFIIILILLWYNSLSLICELFEMKVTLIEVSVQSFIFLWLII
jgi:hypothetical protein